MDRTEKLRLSADAEYCHAFKQGLFARFYEQSLYRFVHMAKPLKPLLEKVKCGDPIIYGGLPINSLEALIEQGRLQQVESTVYGWKWPCAEQKPLSEGAPEFAAWRAAALAALFQTRVQIKPATPVARDILAEIASFNLATHTPMQAMNAIAGWQESMRAGALSV